MLTAIETQVLAKMPEDLRQYVTAKFSTPIKDYSDYDLEMGCYRIVKDTMSAFNPSAKDQTEVIKNIYELLFKDLKRPKFAYVGFTEIEEACYRGVRKEFGDFFSPNISVINGWIDSYLKSKERHEALNWFILNSKQVTVEPIIDKKLFSKEAIKKAFDHYKASGLLPFASFAYYNILVDMVGVEYKGAKTLIADPDLRKKIIKETMENYREKVDAEYNKALKRGRMTEADRLMEMITSNFAGCHTYQNRLKERFLLAYFDSITSLEF